MHLPLRLLLLFLVLVRINAKRCITQEGEQGECVVFDACPEIVKVFADSTSINETRELVRKFTCNENYDYVCCKSPRRFATYGSELSDREYCGYQHTDDYFSDRSNIWMDEFPWLAVLVGHVYYTDGRDAEKEKIMGSGSLINSRYVLTLAQPFDKRRASTLNITRVLLGEYRTTTKTDCVELPQFDIIECNKAEEYLVEDVIVHPFYKSNVLLPYPNDIALVRLNKRVSYSDYVRPICLPVQGTLFAKPGDTLYTTGWGPKIFAGPDSAIKKKIQTILVTPEECQNRFNANGMTIFPEKHICTLDSLNNTEFSCRRDGGAPVMFSRRHQWHIEGIVAVGVLRCGYEYPSIHTRVSSYLEWIKQNMQP